MDQISAALVCDPGRYRRNNQDNFIFDGRMLPAENQGVDGVSTAAMTADQPVLAAVFDGMGGYSNGELAAFLAADAFFRNGEAAFASGGLDILMAQIGDSICAKAEQLRVNDMGTTAAAVCLRDDQLQLVNLGDSRIYLYRNRRLYRLSEDHTNYAMLEKLGIKNRKPELTQYLGMSREIVLAPYKSKVKLLPGDKLLLCTDGLYEALEELTFLRAVRDAGEPEDALRLLLQLAREQGAKDNITAILIAFHSM